MARNACYLFKGKYVLSEEMSEVRRRLLFIGTLPVRRDQFRGLLIETGTFDYCSSTRYGTVYIVHTYYTYHTLTSLSNDSWQMPVNHLLLKALLGQ